VKENVINAVQLGMEKDVESIFWLEVKLIAAVVRKIYQKNLKSNKSEKNYEL
jgi:hypothetical protein